MNPQCVLKDEVYIENRKLKICTFEDLVFCYLSFKNAHLSGLGEVAQLVKCLLFTYSDLS